MTTLDDKKLHLDSAAEMIGTNKYVLRRLVRQRRIPHYRIGRRIVFCCTDLEQFLQAHRVAPAEPVLQ